MCKTNITDDYNDTLSINNNCSNNDINIEIILPLFTVIPYGMSLMCLIFLLVYTLIKLYSIKNKNTYNYKYILYMNLYNNNCQI